MPTQPPSTPWLPNSRFADQSLLLEAQPIFDASFDDESMWGGETMLMVNGNKTQEGKDLDALANGDTEEEVMMDMTLDLGNYLPDEVDKKEVQRKDKATSHGSNRKRGVSETSSSAISTNTTSDSSTSSATASSRLTHKRESSQAMLDVSGPTKRPRRLREKNDDLFSRRLSDSNRRTSLTPIPQISIITTSSSVVKTQGEKGSKANKTPSSSVPSTSSSSQPYSAPSSNTASARLKARLHADDPKSKPFDSSTGYHAQQSEASCQAKIMTEKGSALSRYLARSTVLATKESHEIPAEEGTQKVRDSCASDSNNTKQSSTALSNQPPVQTVPPNPQSYDKNESTTDILHNDSPKKKKSRRSSMGEKVVNFISGLIRPATPATVEIDPKEQKDDERGKENLLFDPLEAAPTIDEEKVQAPISQSDHPVRQKRNEGVSGPGSLTKPIPFSRPLHVRAPPRRNVEAKEQPAKQRPHISKTTAISTCKVPVRAPLQSSRSQPNTRSVHKAGPLSPKFKSNPLHLRPATRSAFASAALAKLPPPGKGHKVAIEPIKVRDVEKGHDIAAIRDVFERLSSTSSSSFNKPPTAGSSTKSHANRPGVLQRTVPLRGHTPGKSSALRAQQRAVFDQAVKEKMEEKERKETEERRRREMEEEMEYRQRRKETVIRANPVPGMYLGSRKQ
ncbi:hypothetical protein CNBG_2807 [Cryptococcus deuterogattii R265]|uniref:TPX2 C-terminal domain-containing protein n=1 Tax=Cryptococcus deuterogattii (strain R265) TaxID=294750 RepID=A0A095CBK3_CRYD2|nr:hypothetical protein CNBG_2807 [Cryptococcus deuterogattii R265]